MDLRFLLLSLTTFAAGLAESILIGILPPLAEDLRVSISLAGQLTTCSPSASPSPHRCSAG